MIAALSATDVVAIIGSLAAAVVSVITALRIGGVKKAVGTVDRKLDTLNETPIGELASEDETRRIGLIPVSKRTAKETRHVTPTQEQEEHS
jgi:hypothetical protein